MLGGKSPGLAVRAFEGGGRGALATATVSVGIGANSSAGGACVLKLGKASDGCSEMGKTGLSSGAGSTEDATALMPALEGGLVLSGALGLTGATCLVFLVLGLVGVVCETPELNTRVCKGPSF